MAGIGFRLNKAVANGGYVQATSVYLSAAIISAGPWLSAIVSLGVFASASTLFLNQSERALLFATITYAFALSLMSSCGIQLVVIRYLADDLYRKQTGNFASLCAGVLCWAVPLFLIASPVLVLAPFEWNYRLLMITLLLTLSLIWLIMAFLSATREYTRIVAIFVLGYALSLVASLVLGRIYGVLGSLAGFTGGQAICLTLLVCHVYLEFPGISSISLDYLAYFRKYWDLFAIGLLYAVSLWIDNILYWFSAQGVVVAGFFRLFPPYDTAKLVGYLLTIPAAAVFLVHIETGVYTHLRGFLGDIENKRPLGEILQVKQGLTKAVWDGVASVAKIQGLVAIAAIYFAPNLASLCGLPADWIPYLRIVIIAASFQYLMLVALLLSLYFDDRRAALKVLVVYVGIDVILTEATIRLGQTGYGIGYLVAAIIGAAVALRYLHQRLRHLEYVTFMLQPFS